MTKLFDGSRLANWSSQQKAQAGRITEDTVMAPRVANGPPWLRFELQAADVDPAGTPDQRSEVLWGSDNNPPAALNDGATVHQVFASRFESPFPVPGDGFSTSNGHSLYNQLKRSTGSPKYSLDSLALSTPKQFQIHYSDDFPSNWSPSHVPHTDDVIHDWIISMKISTSATVGWIEIRHKLSTETDYKVVFPQKFMATAQATTSYIKLGYYRKRNDPATGRKGETKTGVVRHNDFTVYSTLQEAIDHFGATSTPTDPGGGGTPPPVTIIPVDMSVAANRATVFANYDAHAVATDDALRPDKTVAPTAFPHYTVGATGAWVTTGVSNWTSGFLAGFLWAIYERTGVASWKTMAQAWTDPISALKSTDSQDLTLQFITAMEAGYRLTGQQSYKDDLLTAASTMTGRWDATIQAIRSWTFVTAFNTIIDSLLNMETLFWAAKNHTSATTAQGLYDKALAHGLKVQANHVRANGSTYHVVEYNASGVATLKRTHQGYANESTWARGQAWAIHGFTMYYRETLASSPTQAAAFLATAKQCAGYFLDNLPADKIPRWDFDAPATDTQKDTSAAAIAAVGLIELSKYDGTRDWRGAAKQILDALASSWAQTAVADSKAVHAHSVSNKPANTGVDVGYIVTDYYAAQAMQRYLATSPPPDPTLNLVDIDVDFTNLTDTDLDPALQSGGVTIAGGSAQLRVDSGTRIAQFGIKKSLGSGKVVAGGDLATFQSGTGDLTDALSMVIGPAADNNRAVLRKHIKNDTGTPILAIECRMVEANVASVFSVDLAANPEVAAAKAFAIGKSSDGKTVNFLFSPDWTETTRLTATWKLIKSLAFSKDLFSTTTVTFLRVLDLISGSAVVTVSSTERLYGQTGFVASEAPAAGATKARTFNGSTDMLVFPAPTSGFGEPFTEVYVVRHTVDSADAMGGFARNLTDATGGGKYVRHDISTNANTPYDVRLFDPAASSTGRGAGVDMDTNDWSLVFASQTADGYVQVSVFDGSTKTWRHGPVAGPFTVGSAVSSTGKFIVGAPYKLAGALAWEGDIALAGYTLKAMSAADREACVDSSGNTVITNLIAQMSAGLTTPANSASLYDLSDGLAVTSAIQDKIGTRHQDLANSSGSVVTSGLTVPVVAGTGGVVTPPTGTTVGDPAGLTVVSFGVDPGDATKSTVSLKQDPPSAADLAAGVTFVYQRFVPGDVTGGEWVQVATATTAPTTASPKVITGLPRGELVRLRAVARIGAASSGASNEATYTVDPPAVTYTQTHVLNTTHREGTSLVVSWTPNDPAESIDEYKIYVKELPSGSYPTDPNYFGRGVTLADGTRTITLTGPFDRTKAYRLKIVPVDDA